MSNLLRNVSVVAILAIVPLAAPLGAVAGDPTQGRIDAMAKSPSPAYFQCAKFSMRVLQACTETAKRKKQSTRSCRQHYQSNLTRCQAL